VGSTNKQPSPPKLEYPQPTAEEKALLASQNQIAQQMLKQGDILFGQGQEDRQKAETLFQRIQGPQALTADQKQLASDIANSMYEMQSKALTEGPQAQIFNKQRSSALAALAERGVLNSTASQNLLGDIEKQRLYLMDQAGREAGLTNLNLQKGFLDQNMNRDFNLLQTAMTGQASGAQIAGGLLNSAGGVNNSLLGQYSTQRANEFNVNAQNVQAQYLSDLRSAQAANAKQSKINRAIGFGLGGLPGYYVGGLF